MSCFNSGYGKYDARSGIIQYAEWTDSEGARLLEQLFSDLKNVLTDILGVAVLAQVVHYA
jgi:hypothetical protein